MALASRGSAAICAFIPQGDQHNGHCMVAAFFTLVGQESPGRQRPCLSCSPNESLVPRPEPGTQLVLTKCLGMKNE